MSAKSTLHAAWRVRGAGTRTSRTTVNQNQTDPNSDPIFVTLLHYQHQHQHRLCQLSQCRPQLSLQSRSLSSSCLHVQSQYRQQTSFTSVPHHARDHTDRSHRAYRTNTRTTTVPIDIVLYDQCLPHHHQQRPSHLLHQSFVHQMRLPMYQTSHTQPHS